MSPTYIPITGPLGIWSFPFLNAIRMLVFYQSASHYFSLRSSQPFVVNLQSIDTSHMPRPLMEDFSLLQGKQEPKEKQTKEKFDKKYWENVIY